MRIIADNLLPGIAPRHHMTSGALKLDAKSPWRLPSVDARQTNCPTENKSDTAKPPSLTLRSHP
jgi:hypothetical protein